MSSAQSSVPVPAATEYPMNGKKMAGVNGNGNGVLTKNGNGIAVNEAVSGGAANNGFHQQKNGYKKPLSEGLEVMEDQTGGGGVTLGKGKINKRKTGSSGSKAANANFSSARTAPSVVFAEPAVNVDLDNGADDTVMNGIESMKIKDAMDVDLDECSLPTTTSESSSGVDIGVLSSSNEASMSVQQQFGKTPGGPINGMTMSAPAAPPPIVPKCANGKLGCTLDGTPSYPCKRCHRIFYCSEEHRQQHFNEHQPDCKTVSSLEVIFYEEEYSMWLKYAAPHMYDLCLNFVLVWPSLTVQWLPHFEERENNILRHHLLLGTMTNQEQNHLLVCGIDVADRTSTKTDNIVPHAAKFGGSLTVLKRINHEGEVNRARYMPQDCNIVATKSPSPEVFVFDIRKHTEVPEDSTCSPLLRLRGHQKEGFGLCWSTKEKGKLASGSNDGLVCLWDISKSPVVSNGMRFLDASRTLKGHEDVVEDVNWHPEVKHILASVGDDKRLIIWDTRVSDAEAAALQCENAHEGDINAVSFSPFLEYCLATGSSDSIVAVWDMRNLKQRVHGLQYHRSEVMQVQWSPHAESTLASTGKDNRVFVWDLSKVEKGEDSTLSRGNEEECAPNELVFIHGGHIANVNDISWNHHETGMLASVTEDNILQVWKISEELQATYVGGEESDEESQDSSDLMDDC